jgi:hypothetical protein
VVVCMIVVAIVVLIWFPSCIDMGWVMLAVHMVESIGEFQIS